MNAIENFAKIVEEIFGIGAVKFNHLSTTSNNIIGALTNRSNYNTFSTNFIARLSRLKEVYNEDFQSLQNIHNVVAEIASRKNWEGAYAELCAYDFFNISQKTGDAILFEPVKTNITLPAANSLAQYFAQQHVNLDGYIAEYGLYFDVKCLKDNIEEILSGIYADLFKYLKIEEGVDILAEYALDSSYLEFQLNRNALLNELKAKVNVQQRTSYVSSIAMPGLIFRLKWGKGINQAVRGYDPFQHAKNLHSSIFNYTNKLLKTRPTVIVLVSLPWYNQVISDFIDGNLYFYRAFSRRVFCQYRSSMQQYHSLNPKYLGSETLYQISQHVSAIIFLEDKSILGDSDSANNVKSFLYVNPNALNPIPLSAKSYLLSITSGMYDDFENDNY